MSSPSQEVRLTDVTLRDGLQMETVRPSVEQKMALLRRLVGCGYPRIEVTSFVNPKWVPQFADSDAFCQALARETAAAEWMAFVPNERGLERLLAYPIPWVSAFVAVSETFNKKNVNQTIDETLAGLAAVVKRSRAEKRRVRLYVSTVWGCPYEKEIPRAKVMDVLKRVAALGPDEIALSDTIGVALPRAVRELVTEFSAHFPLERTALHLHHTYGLGVAGALAGFEVGVRLFDGSSGGLGGCPYAKGASGNVPTEDLAYAFRRAGALSAFPQTAVGEVLRFLSDELGIAPRGSLREVIVKGGSPYGIE